MVAALGSILVIVTLASPCCSSKVDSSVISNHLDELDILNFIRQYVAQMTRQGETRRPRPSGGTYKRNDGEEALRLYRKRADPWQQQPFSQEDPVIQRSGGRQVKSIPRGRAGNDEIRLYKKGDEGIRLYRKRGIRLY
jgi:hypothetical protein